MSMHAIVSLSFLVDVRHHSYQSPDYGVGYAYAKSVSGPYYKSGSNPILSQDASRAYILII